MNLSELKLKSMTELMELASEFKIENPSNMRKQELIFARITSYNVCYTKLLRSPLSVQIFIPHFTIDPDELYFIPLFIEFGAGFSDSAPVERSNHENSYSLSRSPLPRPHPLRQRMGREPARFRRSP